MRHGRKKIAKKELACETCFFPAEIELKLGKEFSPRTNNNHKLLFQVIKPPRRPLGCCQFYKISLGHLTHNNLTKNISTRIKFL